MKIAIASDHAAKDLKSYIIDFLNLTNHEILDYGVAADAVGSVDYPDYADIVGSEVASGRVDRGILICGTGIGMCISANKFPGVRAAQVFDEFSIKLSVNGRLEQVLNFYEPDSELAKEISKKFEDLYSRFETKDEEIKRRTKTSPGEF